MWGKSYLTLMVRETCGGMERGLVLYGSGLKGFLEGVAFELYET